MKVVDYDNHGMIKGRGEDAVSLRVHQDLSTVGLRLAAENSARNAHVVKSSHMHIDDPLDARRTRLE